MIVAEPQELKDNEPGTSTDNAFKWLSYEDNVGPGVTYGSVS